jgi:hypothetical protein|tara:strand:+ start:342 stop:896 length:555 start_codon:yes stop_codon:yes gene_type:complete
MQVKVNPGEMITPALLTYLLLLVVVWYAWPEEWTNPSSVDIIIFSAGVFVGAALVHFFYYLSFDEKQGEVDEFLTKSEIEIDQKKSELKLHIDHVKDREEFLLEAIDRLNTESSIEVKESETEKELEQVQEPEEELEQVQEPEEEIEEEVDYKSMTVSQIKKILKEKGLSTSGKKTDLVSRLEK